MTAQSFMIRNRICLSTKIGHLFSENKQKQQACDDEVRKYEWMRKLSDVFKRPFIQRDGMPNQVSKFKIIVRTGSLTYRQTPKSICWSPFYRVTLDNFDIMCRKNEHSQSFSEKQNGCCLFVRGPIPPICNFSMA